LFVMRMLTFIAGYVVGQGGKDSNGKKVLARGGKPEINRELNLMGLVDEYLMEDCLRRSIKHAKHNVLEPVYGFVSDLIWEPKKYREFHALLKWDRIGDRITWMAAEINYPTAESKGTEYSKITIPISIDGSYYGDYGLMLKPESCNWVIKTVMKAENML
jgi:hypothetical protein